MRNMFLYTFDYISSSYVSDHGRSDPTPSVLYTYEKIVVTHEKYARQPEYYQIVVNQIILKSGQYMVWVLNGGAVVVDNTLRVYTVESCGNC